MAKQDMAYQHFLFNARSLPKEFHPAQRIVALSEGKRVMKPKASKKKRGK